MNTHSALKSLFLIDPKITYLNFGSFGACPRPIFEDYQNWQLLLEREPVQFIAANGAGNLKTSREALAAYIGCEADDLVYVMNPSYAINIVAKSMKLEAGDEILSTNIEYGALDRTWNYYCTKAGAKYVRQEIPLPLHSKEEFINSFWKGFSSRTKAIFISHICSSTALRLPVEEICAEAKRRDLLTIVDGAHVPGHIPLDLSKLDADVYTGACHKWMMAPKGCSFLFVRKELQDLFDPLIVSWGYNSAMPSHSRFLDYHQMQGTRDSSAFLSVPKTIEFMKENDWTSVAKNCRELAHSNYERFCELLDTTPLCPVNDEFLGQMCSMRIKAPQPEMLQRQLFERYAIEIPVIRQDEKVFIRYSINGFNSGEDLDKLYAALKEIKAEGELIR